MTINRRRGKLYAAWKESVFIRDKYTCQHCFKNDKKLHPHHIKTWDEAPELRTDVDNGLTLCTECHNKHHHIGKIPHNKGKPMSLEQRELLSMIKKGKPCRNLESGWKRPWNKGKTGISSGTPKGTKFSEEHKRKLSERAKNRPPFSEEHKRKLRESAQKRCERQRIQRALG